MKKRFSPRIETHMLLNPYERIRPMRCVDLIAESKEARGPSKPFTKCDVSKFFKELKKNLKEL